jgi:hypothetical protein
MLGITFSSANIKRLIAYTEDTLNGAIYSRQTPPRIPCLVCSTVKGVVRIEQRGHAEVMTWSSKSACAGLRDSSALRGSVVSHLEMSREQQDVSYFLCIEFSYFTFEGMAKLLWRRS